MFYKRNTLESSDWSRALHLHISPIPETSLCVMKHHISVKGSPLEVNRVQENTKSERLLHTVFESSDGVYDLFRTHAHRGLAIMRVWKKELVKFDYPRHMLHVSVNPELWVRQEYIRMIGQRRVQETEQRGSSNMLFPHQ